MSKKLCIVNPFKEEDFKLLEDFEQDNNIKAKIYSYLKSIKETMSKEEYEKKQKNHNDVIQGIYIKDGNYIKDCCFLEGQRDIRKCTISFSPLRKNLKKRFLLSAVTDYALNTLNMEEVFISLEKEDLKTLKQLEQNNYENIGKVNGYLIYLKEKNYS